MGDQKQSHTSLDVTHVSHINIWLHSIKTASGELIHITACELCPSLLIPCRGSQSSWGPLAPSGIANCTHMQESKVAHDGSTQHGSAHLTCA